jgi:hypothetical protein
MKDTLGQIQEAYVDVVNEAKATKVSILKTPKTSDYGGYEGRWDADVGVTNADVIDSIKKKIGKSVKWVAIFDHQGYEREKPTPFKGSGKWTAK